MIEEQEGKLLSSLDPTRAARTATASATATAKTATPTATTTTATTTTATTTTATAIATATTPTAPSTAAAATTTASDGAAVPSSAAEGSMDIVPTDSTAPVSAEDKDCSALSAESSAMEVDLEVEAVVGAKAVLDLVEVKSEAVPITDIDVDISADPKVDLRAEKELETKTEVDGGVVIEAAAVVVEVKNEAKEEVDVKIEDDVEAVAALTVGAQDSAPFSRSEEGGKELQVAEELKMEESEAREWRRLFVSACRWFDLDQV